MQKFNAMEYGPSPTRDFRLWFVLEQSMLMDDGAIISKVFAGEGAFLWATNWLLSVAGVGFAVRG